MLGHGLELNPLPTYASTILQFLSRQSFAVAFTMVAISSRNDSIGTAINFCSSPSSTMPCTAENRLRAVTPSSSGDHFGNSPPADVDVAEQFHLLLDRPFRNRLFRRHAVLEQRAPEFEIFSGEIAIADRDPHQRLGRRGGTSAFRLRQRRIEPASVRDPTRRISSSISSTRLYTAPFATPISPRQFPVFSPAKTLRRDGSVPLQGSAIRVVFLVFPML